MKSRWSDACAKALDEVTAKESAGAGHQNVHVREPIWNRQDAKDAKTRNLDFKSEI